jgi:4-hydroxybenzoate polyprenyltransferase
MDRKLKAESISLLLLFAAFPLTSFGKLGNSPLVWWIGLLCLVAGGALPVVTRFMDHSGDRIRDVGIEFDDRTS